MTPLRLLELFFDDVLVDMIFGYTKLYSDREKADISFEITNEKIHLFVTWPTIFTRPNITHFEEKNSRPDF